MWKKRRIVNDRITTGILLLTVLKLGNSKHLASQRAQRSLRGKSLQMLETSNQVSDVYFPLFLLK